jgi:hypothetical protein
MAASPSALRLIAGVRRRRLDQLELQLPRRLEEQRAREEERAQADEAEAGCRADERRCEDKIFGVAEAGTFKAGDVVTLQHVLDTLKGKTRQAAKASADAAKRVQEAIAAVAQARRAVHRARLQLEFIEKKLKETLQAIDRAQEDAQDEEAEESSVARLLAARPARSANFA